MTQVGHLTPREREVARLLALGLTNREIAREFHLSVRTVESHRANLRRKLGIASRAELVRFALEHGLFEP
jgi:DNA-binding NarL/FixJ family response regulator